MACNKTIRTLFPLPTGGVWIYRGYNSTSDTGPSGEVPANPLFPGIPVDAIIPWGDNFLVNNDGVTPGWYFLGYEFEGVETSYILKVQEDTICAGIDVSVSYSASNSTPQNLFDLLDAPGCPVVAAGGSWTNVDGAAGFSAPNLTPSTAGAGLFHFIYSIVDAGYEEANCPDCPELMATVTVTISGSFEVNIIDTDANCQFTLDLIHPDSSTEDLVKVEIDTTLSKAFPVYRFKQKVTDSCGTPTFTSATITHAPNSNLGTGVTTGGTNTMQAGGFVETLNVFSVTTGTIVIPLAPSGANQAVFSGSGGTTNATALTFNGSDRTAFSNALRIAIRNYLIDVEGLTEGNDFFLAPITFTTSFVLNIYFGPYHNAPSNWVGIPRSSPSMSYNRNGSTPITTTTEALLVTLSTVIQSEYTQAPCLLGVKKLIYHTGNISSLIDIPALDYDNVSLTASSAIITPVGVNSNTEEDCDSKSLFAQTMGCGGVVTYDWSPGGETTASITRVIGTGLYEVEATCSSPAASDTDSIVI